MRERAMPYGDESGEPVMLALGEDYPELRRAIEDLDTLADAGEVARLAAR